MTDERAGDGALGGVAGAPTAASASVPGVTNVTMTTVGAVGARVGRYELLVELASGGMATVFIGRQRGAGGFERIVAIKRMHPHIGANPELAASFLDEARIASLIHHPNVVSVHDVHDEGGERLLVMDYVEGVSLSALVRAARKQGIAIPRPVGLKVVSEALRGLHAAHEQRNMSGEPLNIVHRDATPQNILLGVDGAVKITDFGIARAAERQTETAAGQVKGKFRYMAPEQAMGKPLDRRVDVFAMGAVLYEVLSGKRLVDGHSDAEVLRAVAMGDFAPLHEVDPTVPRELSDVVMRATAFEAAARWPTAEAFAAAIDAWAKQRSKTATATEIARVVNELCGAAIAERTQQVRDVLAGKRAPVVLPTAAPDAAASAGLLTPVSTASQLTGLPVATSRSADGEASTRPRRVGGVVAGMVVVAGVVALGAGGFVLSRGGSARPAIAPTVAATGGAAGAGGGAEARVRVKVNCERKVAEVVAARIEDIAFRDDGVSFSLPRNSAPVEVRFRLVDGVEVRERVTPEGDIALRLMPAAGVASAASGATAAVASALPVEPAGEKKKGATSTKGDAPRPAAQGKQLRKNPYE